MFVQVIGGVRESGEDICGEARIVERAFGIGASVLAEAAAVITEQLELQPA